MPTVKHGLSDTRVYRVWRSMLRRCYFAGSDNYKWYGGRGIRVCKEWMDSVSAFAEWAYSNGYDDSLSIDRIDTDGDYCPENCRFVTMKHQARNRRKNATVTCFGKTQTIAAWAEEMNVDPSALYARYESGWKDEDIIRTPVKKFARSAKHKIILEIDGEKVPLAEACKIYNQPWSVIYWRIRNGWDAKTAVLTPRTANNQFTVNHA